MDPHVSLGSMVSSAVMTGDLSQGLVLRSMASVPSPPLTVGSVAYSLPQGSMLIGLTTCPHHGALAEEGSTVPFQASYATSVAQAHPHALEASGRAKRVPTVLQKASKLSHPLGTMAVGTKDGQAMMKLEDLNETPVPGVQIHRESIVLEATPWMSESPQGSDVNYGHELLAEDKIVPKGPRLPLEEVAPS